jgi:hypothetical protein
MWQNLDVHYQDVKSYLELLNEDEDVALDADIATSSNTKSNSKYDLTS